MTAVTLDAVSMRYPNGPMVLDDLSLNVADGELLSIVGPSGSGKTTILRLIAGLERPTSGHVLFDGVPVDTTGPRERNVAMVFQDGALFGHLDVGKNIGFPLTVRRVRQEEIDRRVDEGARQMGVRRLIRRKPAELSAGHRHAAATARATVRESTVLLFDEPLATLDARARRSVRVELMRLHRELGTTMVYVTNDTNEAMAIGDRIAVLDDDGRLLQVAGPRTVYDRPASTFVAGFVGDINLFETRLEAGSGRWWVEIGHDRPRVPEDVVRGFGLDRYRGKRLVVGIRPEHLSPAGPGTPFEQCLHGLVRSVADVGPDLLVDMESSAVRYSARFPARRSVATGHRLELVIDTERLLFFGAGDGRLVT